MFRSARLKLTLAYTIGIALIVAAFSVALYLALQRVLAGTLEVEGSGGARLAQAVLSAELARVRLTLLTVNLGGWVLSALISYLMAGRTLRPIEAAMGRQRQFTAHASHELRTPLTVIKGEVDVTLARERAPAAYRETLRRVNAEVDHLERTVSDLLALAQVDASQSTSDRERRVVEDMLGAAAEPFMALASRQEVRLMVTVSPGLEASLDWPRVEHVVRNLLSNALRHTPGGGEIQVKARQHGGDLELSVFNTGDHIAASDLPHLFVPFFRGRGSQSDVGTGLGLGLCDWVARAHGGSIAAHNVAAGVSFVVRLPRGMK